MTNPPGAMPPLPEQAWWLSHDVLAQKNRIDKLPVQSLQPGAYQHTKLYTADQLQAYAATLIARVAELQADAARWREIRRSHEESDSGESICVFDPDHGAHCLQPVGSMPGELDAAIDAAIAVRKEQP